MFVRGGEARVTQVGPGVTRQVLGYDDSIMMVRFSFQPGAVGALHHHPHTQVSYVERGRFEATVAGQVTVLERGDSFLVPSEAVHGVVALEEGSLVDVFSPARQDFLEP
jgi:quercetin dioxygenase-like cupin family protein